MEKIQEIVTKAQNGDSQARAELVKSMMDNGYMRRLNRFLYLNRLLHPDDVRSEFWVGVLQAIPTTKVDIGDPLQYLAFKGVMNVRSVLRNTLSRRVFYMCNMCGHENALRRRNDVLICHKCGSTDLETKEREAYSDTPPEKIVKNVKRTVIEKIEIEERILTFREKLTGQEKRVFDCITSGIDRDESDNYLKDIGSKLGISSQCINQYLKRIRRKYNERSTAE